VTSRPAGLGARTSREQGVVAFGPTRPADMTATRVQPRVRPGATPLPPPPTDRDHHLPLPSHIAILNHRHPRDPAARPIPVCRARRNRSSDSSSA
jgi:hypothetical protein